MEEVLQMQTAFDRYLSLSSEVKAIVATYIYLDRRGRICAKSRTLPSEPKSVRDLPVWSFGVDDDPTNSDAILVPVALFRNPFLKDPHKLVLCEGHRNGSVYAPNKRSACEEVMKLCTDHEIQIGMEQEFTLLGSDGHPYNWPKNGCPKQPMESLHYFTGVGPDRVYGRALSEAHFLACLYAGVKISGTNSEATPSQWEYQIGPCEGVEIGDHMLVARYILLRCSEDFGVTVTFDPRPVEGRWTGAGCHINFSTKATRAEGGISAIHDAIGRLSKRIPEHLAAYDPHGGADNERRLKAGVFCPKIDEFTWGVADRKATVRIPRLVADAGKGYFEDRRPSSNCDPYDVARVMAETICLER